MTVQLVLATIFGFLFISALFGVAVYIITRPDPRKIPPEAMFIFRVILALAGAGVGAIFPGFLEFESNMKEIVIRAGGALAVFTIIYLLNPPKLTKGRIPNLTDQRNPSLPSELQEPTINKRFREIWTNEQLIKQDKILQTKKLFEKIDDPPLLYTSFDLLIDIKNHAGDCEITWTMDATNIGRKDVLGEPKSIWFENNQSGEINLKVEGHNGAPIRLEIRRDYENYKELLGRFIASLFYFTLFYPLMRRRHTTTLKNTAISGLLND